MAPIPKRSDQLIRRNKPEIPIQKVPVIGTVHRPELGLPDPHPLVSDFYNSLTHSGQSQYYEPSDWQYARLACHFADQLLKSDRPSAQILVTVNQMFTNLLVAEGERRRVRMEIERTPPEQQKNNVVSFSDVVRARLEGR